MAKRTRKPTERETALENQLSDLQLQRMAAVWMLRNNQPFLPETWMCVSGPRFTRLLARTDESGFPSEVWHEATLTADVRFKILYGLTSAGKDAEWLQCAQALDAVMVAA